MPRLGASCFSAILGIIGAIVLVVLDKGGKLKNPTTLAILLFIAAALALPLALSNSWVYKAPSGILKFFRGMAGVCLVGLLYSALCIWIFTPTEEEKVAPTINNLDQRISILEQLQIQANNKQISKGDDSNVGQPSH